jgi:hypothetical protein
LSNTRIIYSAGQFDEVNRLFYSDGSSLTGWTNAGITIDSVIGNPINSFKSTGANQYAYINPANITSFVGKTIQVDMRATGAVPLVDFFFGCNIFGAGQQARLECRIGNGTGFASTSAWTSWNAPPGSTSLIVDTWYTFKIQINSTNINGMSLYINGNLFGTGTFVDNGGYIGLQGDGGSGGNWDNINIFDRIV